MIFRARELFVAVAAPFMVLLLQTAAYPAELIRVLISDDEVSVKVREAVPAAKVQRIVTPASLENGLLQIPAGPGYNEVNGKRYRGSIEIRKKRNGKLLVINELDLEEYLKGVIAAEMPHSWEPEALKAQSIASRTYALYQKRMSGKRAYHVRATVDSQVYMGRSGERAAAGRAIRDTQGIVISYEGAPIEAFYHSSCGGHTENAFWLWGINAPYLKGVDCECQEISRFGIWEKRMSAVAVSRLLGKTGHPLGAMRGIGIGDITPAGRVKEVAIRHSQGNLSLPAEKFRALLGYSFVPSVFFEVELSGDEIVISGRGAGHGVGLCQWGAQEMAIRGYDYRAILSHYYPGTKLIKRENH